MRKIARVDNNQKEIVRALRQMGCSVFSTAQLGNGFPDLCVGFRNRNYLFEIKNPELPPSKQKLTNDEVLFHQSWRGQVCVVTTFEDVFGII